MSKTIRSPKDNGTKGSSVKTKHEMEQRKMRVLFFKNKRRPQTMTFMDKVQRTRDQMALKMIVLDHPK